MSSIWCHIPLNDCDIWTYHQHACLSIQLLFMGDVCIWMWGKIWESIFVYDTSKFGKDISIVKILEHLVPISITLVKLKWEGKSRAIMKTPRNQKQIKVYFIKCVKSHSQYSPLWYSKCDGCPKISTMYILVNTTCLILFTQSYILITFNSQALLFV